MMQKRSLFLPMVGIVLGLTCSAGLSARPDAARAVRLWRLDCGTFSAPKDAFSDLFAQPGERGGYVDSCYLIRHGDDLLLWDAGLPLALLGKPADTAMPVHMRLGLSIADQLARLGLKPADVTILALSHMHSDHTGQAAAFPQARLVIDGRDFAALRQSPPPFFTDPASLRPWLSGEAKVTPISGDHDVFGDGSVIMVALPGHTAGNHGLLVRLTRTGAVLLSGDALHAPGQLSDHGLPPSNVSRADSIASLDRITGMIRDARVKLVVQHDEASVNTLPAFPQAADRDRFTRIFVHQTERGG